VGAHESEAHLVQARFGEGWRCASVLGPVAMVAESADLEKDQLAADPAYQACYGRESHAKIFK